MSIHLKGLVPGDLGEGTVVVGDPGRVSLVSELLDDVRQLSDNRDLVLVAGTYQGHPVSVGATGMGAGSTEIVVTELIENGARAIVRCGGCGAWREGIAPGEIIMNSGMARSQGLMGAYVPETYPAVADPFLLTRVHERVSASGLKVHVGIGLTSETYYLGQGRRPGFASRLQPDPGLIDSWVSRGVLNCEMETAVLYVLGAVYGVPVANSLVVHVSRTNEKWASDSDYARIHKQAAKAVLEGMVLGA